MEKRFDPSSYEAKWQRHWAERGYFVAEAPTARRPFCIMIPPPNVTGKLHLGHALQSTLQDLLTRWKRMQGFNALWLPGTDHAGIATQLMVERELAKEGITRHDLGREKFLERMWEWKARHHGSIRRQLDLLGASCDWTRERFTLDPGLSRAVREAFVRLHRDGLITRGEYVVNWSPELGTAISDLEVEWRPVKGKLYHLAYPIGDTGEVAVVATTRPETMLGDTALAFHPADERWRPYAQRQAVLPLVGRRLPFVADPAVDPEFGTGLVKVTPAHDALDFELARRHGLPAVRVIDERGRMTEAAGADFAGLDRFAARERVVEKLRQQGRLLKVEEHEHNVGHSQRSGEPIEPLISAQWFCDVSGMAAQALAALHDGRLRLVPDSWGKTWEHWLENIRPWCISRQIWWGHQIPAWYTPSGEVFVAGSREEAARAAGTAELTQDPDVLDTWFSSALWPFSTLGWPEDTVDLRTFYPNDVLVTGFDILFFWVARMVMTGLHFTGRSPFHTVHLTGLVRDPEGQKMSKTRGNVVDPETLVADHGADALRFTLAILDSPGRDIPLDLERMAGYRAFGNKIWNAARFALEGPGGGPRTGRARVQATLSSVGELHTPERWILSRLSKVAGVVNERLDAFRFDEACGALYHFVWGDLCDWYIEMAKPALGSDPRPRAGEVLLTVLDRSLRLLHPIMPFITEELWQRLPGREGIHAETICLAEYPTRVPEWEDERADQLVQDLRVLANRVRNQRVEAGLLPKERVELYLRGSADPVQALSNYFGDLPWKLLLWGMAGVRVVIPEIIDAGNLHTPPQGTVAIGGQLLPFRIEAASRTDTPLPRAKLLTQLAELEGQIADTERALGDPQFISKAPTHIVEGRRRKLEELKEQRRELASFTELGS